MLYRSSLETLQRTAVQVLAENDLGKSTKPAPRLYPHQWNWDSAFVAVGLSHINEERAQQEILSLLRGQWRNGMVPHIIFSPGAGPYFPGPDYWISSSSADAPVDVQTSGITQPPVLATAALRIYQNSKDKTSSKAFLERVFDSLLRSHRFFYEYRNYSGDGLVYIVHPWESGQDNSPIWDRALASIEMKWKPAYKRVDITIVDAGERPTSFEYDRYTYMVELFRGLKYSPVEIERQSPFLVQSVLFNSILCQATQDLCEIARVLGRDASEIERWAEQSRTAIGNSLWNEEQVSYFDFDLRAGEYIKQRTLSGFMPLYAGIPDANKAAVLIHELTSETDYWPKSGYPVCSIPMTDPMFDSRKYWRGPVWVNTNWFVIKGLQRYGYDDLAEKLVDSTLEMVIDNGFHEYFNPFTGKGHGSDRYAWTAALIIEMIASRCRMV